MVKVPNSYDATHLAPHPDSTVSNALEDCSIAFSSFSSKELEGASEAAITRWLEQLLRHFGIHELKNSSDQQLIALMASCESGRPSAFQNAVLRDRALLSALKRRIIRLAGAQLDTAFVSMAPEVINLEDTDAITLNIESQILRGLRYQGEVYRLVESFARCHRLQAFCLGQTLRERGTAYLMTQSSNGPSSDSFSVWVNIRALWQGRSRHHLSSNPDITDLAS